MSNPFNHFFVITGGPGAGKTTLLQELQKRFFTVIPEVAKPGLEMLCPIGWCRTPKFSLN
jgi:predicted ATPase